MKAISGLVFVLSTLPAHADQIVHFGMRREALPNPESCASIDLLKDNSDFRWTINPDQYTTNWCSAYAVADALSYNEGVSISPAVLGLHAEIRAENIKPDPKRSLLSPLTRNMGVCEAVNTAFEVGFCDINELEKNGVTGITMVELSKIYEEAQRLRRGQPGVSYRQTIHQSIEKLHSSEPNKSATYFDLLTSAEVPENSTKIEEVLVPVTKRYCGNMRKLRGSKRCSYFVRSHAGDLTAEIDRQLGNRFMPVMTFNESHIYKKSVGLPDYAPHAVTINARRWNEERQRCEYRVRTTVKVDRCEDHLPNVTCTTDEISRGMLWLSADVINGADFGNIAIVGGHRRRMQVYLPSDFNPKGAAQPESIPASRQSRYDTGSQQGIGVGQ